MELDEIREELKKRGYTIEDLAAELGMNRSSVSRVLNGTNPLKESLRRHIELLLKGGDEAVFVYRVNLTSSQVRELCGEKYLGAAEDKNGALQLSARASRALRLIIMHNLKRLAEAGKESPAWSPEDRAEIEALLNSKDAE